MDVHNARFALQGCSVDVEVAAALLWSTWAFVRICKCCGVWLKRSFDLETLRVGFLWRVELQQLPIWKVEIYDSPLSNMKWRMKNELHISMDAKIVGKVIPGWHDTGAFGQNSPGPSQLHFLVNRLFQNSSFLKTDEAFYNTIWFVNKPSDTLVHKSQNYVIVKNYLFCKDSGNKVEKFVVFRIV